MDMNAHDISILTSVFSKLSEQLKKGEFNWLWVHFLLKAEKVFVSPCKLYFCSATYFDKT